jgi:hypothetical protein
MTKGLLISRQTKLSLEKKYAQNPSVANCEKYKSYRNLYNTIIRLCKKKYYSDELEQNSKNLKKTWSLLNEVLRKNNSKQPINSLFHKGKLLTDPTQIANAFNHYFTTIADEIAKQINPTMSNGEPVDDSYDDFVTNTGRHCFNLADKPATDDEILMCIRKLEDKKTPDMMGFSSYLLKKVSYPLLTPLRHIFNRSFATGCVPSKMKIAKVIPIFKSGDASDINNYRPISLLSTFSKILEKIVQSRLFDYLETHNLITSQQFGFRPSHSTVHPMTLLLNKVTAALNDKKTLNNNFL